jgi:hypothetical protein
VQSSGFCTGKEGRVVCADVKHATVQTTTKKHPHVCSSVITRGSFWSERHIDARPSIARLIFSLSSLDLETFPFSFASNSTTVQTVDTGRLLLTVPVGLMCCCSTMLLRARLISDNMILMLQFAVEMRGEE